jgi:Uma2 family endonuclease
MKPPKTLSNQPARPTLENGEQMRQPEFHRRYLAHPGTTKFELIGGVVYMASPMREPHGHYTSKLNLVFSLYELSTPGTRATEGISAILGDKSEPQPDLILRLLPEYGGLAKLDEDEYLVGPPELVVEVAYSTRAIDMNRKRQDYLAAGVQEYLVLCVEEREIHWFHFPSKRKLKADKAGLWKSRVFPGLWLDGPAVVDCDSTRLVAALQKGLATAEHADFVRRLKERQSR